MMRDQALWKATECGRLAEAETDAMRRRAFRLMRSLWLRFADGPAVYSETSAQQLAALLAVEALIARSRRLH